MELKKLFQNIKILNEIELNNKQVESIHINTKDKMSNSLFICIKGGNVDSHKLKSEAQKKGAIAFVVEELDKNFNGLQILVENSRQALSIIAKNFYGENGYPKIIGITGTNGKTTTTYILANILQSAGKKVGVIGTEGIKYDNKSLDIGMTTPDPIELFKYLGLMQKCGVECAVMEVSAHAIALNKIDAIDFYAKALTNISEDHLDFFKNMDNYSKCKTDFIKSGNALKIVNNDDLFGREISSTNDEVFTYAIDNPADVFAINISNDCSEFYVNLFDSVLKISSKLLGKYNVENMLCAILLAKVIGIEDKAIVDGIASFNAVEGRMNVYKKGNNKVIIDFAHTPDGLEKLLSCVKKFCNGKLICVFGCGGNRDGQKRSIMGQIAGQISDYCIITNDNPRLEEPIDIARQIASKMKKDSYEIVLDRRQAIDKAISLLSDGDIIALCGKGAETYMDIQGVKTHYSDKEEIEARGFKS